MSRDASDAPDYRRTITLVALCLLAFLGGAVSTQFETFPYPQLLERPFFAARAYLSRAGKGNSPSDSPRWLPAPTDETGVTRHRPGADDGLTLYISGGRRSAQLITPTGEVAHEWELSFPDAWPDPPHLDGPVDASSINWAAAHLFPNGDLLVNFTAQNVTPYGYGLVKIDRDSEILWQLPAQTHHDVTVADDGTIYALTHESRPRAESPIEPSFVDAPFVLDDEILRIASDGDPLERLSLLDAIAKSPYARILTRWYDHDVSWDRLHTNSVKPIPPGFARHHDFADPGDLLVSFRSLNAIGLVDLEAGELTWAHRGPWLAQHDPDPLPNGHLLIFDNKGHAGPTGCSRILEYDPAKEAIVWQYTGSADNPFETPWRGEQEPLANGNVLVNDATGGRLFEVTRDGQVVWAFHNPDRRTRNGTEYVGVLGHGVQRVDREQLDFLSER